MNMSVCDKAWIGRSVFVSKGNLSSPLKNWYYPSDVVQSSKPVAGQYFTHLLFLWMPRRMFIFDFKCPNCMNKSL